VVQNTKNLKTKGGNDGIFVSMAGARIHQNAFLLDGTDIRGARGNMPAGAAGSVAGIETIKEFKVITGAFSAEYGQFTGGVITAITKSGTNDLHGSVYNYHRNAVLDARNFFDVDPLNPLERSKVPNFIRNQFGFSLGGPIVKDKTFIFASLEVIRKREKLNPGADGIFVLSEDARAGRLFGPNSPDMKEIIDMIPPANGRDLGGGIAEYFNAENYPTDGEALTIRVDHEFSDSDSFFARYTLDQSDRTYFWSNQADLNNVYRYQYLTLSEKHVFSPNVINEVRVGFTRSKTLQNPIESPFDDAPINPGLRFSVQTPPAGPTIPQILGVFRWGSFLGLTSVPNHFSYSDDLNWTKGSHFLKMGATYTRIQHNGKSTTVVNGLYIMPSVFLFLHANPVSLQFAATDIASNLFGFYLQDDWKFSPNLTLNLGLRYEFITSPTEVGTGEFIGRPEIEGRLANLVNVTDPVQHIGNPYFNNPSLKNFSPRIGFACFWKLQDIASRGIWLVSRSVDRLSVFKRE
jgi:outer membrane receptor protein involved in Fe transport